MSKTITLGKKKYELAYTDLGEDSACEMCDLNIECSIRINKNPDGEQE